MEVQSSIKHQSKVILRSGRQKEVEERTELVGMHVYLLSPQSVCEHQQYIISYCVNLNNKHFISTSHDLIVLNIA